MQTVLYPNNQLVYVRNNERRKFDPLFGPQLHKVIDVRGNGTTLLRLDDDRIIRRHLDDVKDVSLARLEEDNTCWVESNTENAPARQPPLAEQPPILPLQPAPAPLEIVQRRTGRNRNEPDRFGDWADAAQVDEELEALDEDAE